MSTTNVQTSWAWTASLAAVIPAEGPALVVLMGAQGSGKSTRAAAVAQLPDPPVVVSLDRCRAECSPHGDESDQNVTDKAVDLMLELVDEHLAGGKRVVVDSTAATIPARQALLAVARPHGAPAIAAVLSRDEEETLALNARRSADPGPSGFPRRVPESRVQKARADLERDLPTMASEGWTQVWRIDHRHDDEAREASAMRFSVRRGMRAFAATFRRYPVSMGVTSLYVMYAAGALCGLVPNTPLTKAIYYVVGAGLLVWLMVLQVAEWRRRSAAAPSSVTSFGVTWRRIGFDHPPCWLAEGFEVELVGSEVSGVRDLVWWLIDPREGEEPFHIGMGSFEAAAARTSLRLDRASRNRMVDPPAVTVDHDGLTYEVFDLGLASAHLIGFFAIYTRAEFVTDFGAPRPEDDLHELARLAVVSALCAREGARARQERRDAVGRHNVQDAEPSAKDL